MSQLFGNAPPDYNFSPDADASNDGYVMAYDHPSRTVRLTDGSTLPSGDSLNGLSITFSEDGGAGTFPAANVDYVVQEASKGTVVQMRTELVASSTDLMGGNFIVSDAAVPAGLRPDEQTTVGTAEFSQGGTITSGTVRVLTDGSLAIRPDPSLAVGPAQIIAFSVSWYQKA